MTETLFFIAMFTINRGIVPSLYDEIKGIIEIGFIFFKRQCENERLNFYIYWPLPSIWDFCFVIIFTSGCHFVKQMPAI